MVCRLGMRLDAALLNLLQVAGRYRVLHGRVLARVGVQVLHWSVPFIGPIACNRRAA